MERKRRNIASSEFVSERTKKKFNEKKYLCFMIDYKEKICVEYALSIEQLNSLLAEMDTVHFNKGDFVVREGERNTSLYILKSGVWRSFRMNDGEEMTLWFAAAGECVFAMWGYALGAPSQTDIEVEVDSEAYMISKSKIDDLCAQSLMMANSIRSIFEHHEIGRAHV